MTLLTSLSFFPDSYRSVTIQKAKDKSQICWLCASFWAYNKCRCQINENYPNSQLPRMQHFLRQSVCPSQFGLVEMSHNKSQKSASFPVQRQEASDLIWMQTPTNSQLRAFHSCAQTDWASVNVFSKSDHVKPAPESQQSKWHKKWQPLSISATFYSV